MSQRRSAPVGTLACVLAGLALGGPACGRIGLDQPVGSDDGTGGASQAGGHSGTPGVGGSVGPPPCHQITDEPTCAARGAACRPDSCKDFVRCATPDDPRLPCPATPDLLPCSTTKDPYPIACREPLAWCHPIYSPMPPPEVCPPPLVCATLVGCGDNGTAQCVGATGTRCGGDPPSCAPGYVASIDSAGCYEGCVPLFYCGS